MLTPSTPREHVIAKLGARCSRCSWDEDPSILQIASSDGSIKKKSRNSSSDKIYMTILGELEDPTSASTYRCLCPNCKFVTMAQARRAKWQNAPTGPIAVRPPIFLWQTELPVALAVGSKHLFVEKEIAKGAEALVIVEDGRIYEYGKPDTPIADNWEELRCLKPGLPSQPPNSNMAVIG